jgi:hypothetical protein
LSALRTAAAATLAASALAVTLPVSAAHAATPSPGRASAVTAELDLDVSLLNNAVDIPVAISLNKVETPARSSDAMLTAKVDGVDQGRPVTLVKADVGTSTTTADEHGTAASVRLVGADVHAPGLPLTTLLGLEALSAEVTCPVDGPPTAKVTAPAKVTVLGRPVTLGLNGPTHVNVPGIGSVDVQFSKRTTTSTTAAASALEVQVDINPLRLNVAKVTGRITVASVGCEKPVPVDAASSTPTTEGPAPATTAARAATGALASTGSSGTGTLLGGSGALLVIGTGVLLATRRRRAHARRH